MEETTKYVTAKDLGWYEATGAECMTKFIADGCKGVIYLNAESATPILDKYSWSCRAHHCEWYLYWLAKLCTYVPPEPVYQDATPGEALNAWLVGKPVQVNIPDDAPIDGRGWITINTNYQAWHERREYRIEIL